MALKHMLGPAMFCLSVDIAVMVVALVGFGG
jgi:hypothetical protein